MSVAKSLAVPCFRALSIVVLGPLVWVACANDPPPVTAEPPRKEQPQPVDPGPGPCTTPACTPLEPVAPYEGDHPLDAAVHEAFERAGVIFRPAGELELCRRLMGDLVGKLPTAEEFAANCSGKSAEEIIRTLQASDRYLLVAERWWRDRMSTTDILTDWRYLKDLYLLVDQLHAGTLTYRDFAIEALAHPGFISQDFSAEDIARRSFRTFLGRPATDAEAVDLAGLFRPWLASYATDPDFPEIQTVFTFIAPEYCSSLTRCRTDLFGGAELDIPARIFVPYIYWQDLDPFQLDALRVVGRLFVEQPIFWEAAADALLSRYLGWSDGGRFPREPGIILPELRVALADYLQRTGDLPGAERLLLTSRLYLQSAIVEPDGFGDDPHAPQLPVFAYGPVKAANAETWLDSVAPLTFGGMGTCDPRYPEFYSMILLYDAFDRGAITSTAALGDSLLRLYQLQEGKYPMVEGENGYYEPSGYYNYYARQLGGCPGFGAVRGEATGLAFGFAQESFAELACLYADFATPPGVLEPSLAQIVDHQMKTVYGRSATVEEQAIFQSARNNCVGEECSSNRTVSSVCTALVGSAEMLFY